MHRSFDVFVPVSCYFKLGLDWILFWPDTKYLADYLCRINGYTVIKKYCHEIYIYSKIRVGPSVCPSKCLYTCPSVRPSICNMNELLLTYCHSIMNLRNYDIQSDNFNIRYPAKPFFE